MTIFAKALEILSCVMDVLGIFNRNYSVLLLYRFQRKFMPVDLDIKYNYLLVYKYKKFQNKVKLH